MTTLDDFWSDLGGLFDPIDDSSKPDDNRERLPAQVSGHSIVGQRKGEKLTTGASWAKYGYLKLCPNNKHLFYCDKGMSCLSCIRCGALNFSQDIPASYRLSRHIRQLNSGYMEPFFDEN